MAVAFGLLSVMIRVEVPLTATAGGIKTFDTSGGSNTVRAALAPALFEPPVEVRSPAAIALV